VKVTYMVQNIEDPEIYASFLVKKETPEHFISLKYRENFPKDISSYDLENDNVLSERLPLYCIPITGLNHVFVKSKGMEIEEISNETLKYQDIHIKFQEKVSDFFTKLKEKGIFNSNSDKGFPAIIKVFF